jgi:7,8-dihydropterin-6-yl-methyl-4-(beta-D-ribofuranosyl)aminobenzene 5'-phosphate synthase
MRRGTTLLSLILLLCLNHVLSGQGYLRLTDNGGLSRVNATSGITAPVTVKVIYDNYVCTEGLTADWGYSVLIAGSDWEILFDTGTKPGVFESNFREMGLDPSAIDLLALSHDHGDHTGAVASFAAMKTGIPVLMPESSSEPFKMRMAALGLKPLLAVGPAMIYEHLFTSGEFDYEIPEQALVLDTRKGLVVMTGCSHPGIVDMLKDIETSFGKNVYMVFGGFHLMDKSDKEMEVIIREMKSMGVVKCGATHCTGDRQIKMFREAFGSDYFELGAGKVIVIN